MPAVQNRLVRSRSLFSSNPIIKKASRGQDAISSSNFGALQTIKRLKLREIEQVVVAVEVKVEARTLALD